MLRVSGQNLDIGDALRTHVQSRVADALSKYFDRNYSGHVTVKKEGTGFRTDCLIQKLMPAGHNVGETSNYASHFRSE